MEAPFTPLQTGNLDVLAIVIVIIIVVTVIALYMLWIGGAIFKRPMTGSESLVGKHGTASTDLTAEGGEVIVDGIIWKARLSPKAGDKIIAKGEAIVVVGVYSLTLIVEKSVMT